MNENTPMTPAQQLFAEEHHNLVYAFLNEKKLPEDEYYDVVVFGYLQAVMDYEDICEERMRELNVNNTWPFQFSKLGGYWDAKNEIDIAALDPEGKNLILGECKYWKEPVGLNVLHALEAKVCDVAWERDRRKVWYVLFSISGFSDELRNHAATRDDLLLIDDGER